MNPDRERLELLGGIDGLGIVGGGLDTIDALAVLVEDGSDVRADGRGGAEAVRVTPGDGDGAVPALREPGDRESARVVVAQLGSPIEQGDDGLVVVLPFGVHGRLLGCDDDEGPITRVLHRVPGQSDMELADPVGAALARAVEKEQRLAPTLRGFVDHDLAGVSLPIELHRDVIDPEHGRVVVH